MSTLNSVSDQAQRLRALQSETSFIVQAPAGSGKTGLLTQRFLVLLARVASPEEVVAITFTRKAASEMRQRILQALVDAGEETPPQEAYAHQTWVLARKVLAWNKRQGWQLLENPSRLRIQTIDSLCAFLVRQMPVLSRCGSLPTIAEQPETLYMQAAENTLAEIESDAGWAGDIKKLVMHLDNHLEKLQALIAAMLARRDQWLRHMGSADGRPVLEAALQYLVETVLCSLCKAIPTEWVDELLLLMRFAAGHLQDSDLSLRYCTDWQSLPDTEAKNRSQWLIVVDFLLTKEGGWRKTVNKSMGFPAESSTKDKAQKDYLKTMKQRMQVLLGDLQTCPALLPLLQTVRLLPPHRYNEAEWDTLQSLIVILRLAVAQLELVFSQQGQVDYPAMTLAATEALGRPDDPTDLALALDYRIQHILVDEFQDTSINQFELFKCLTAGWQPGDGRTLFLVGDPMQSIYRFREADVGLFLQAREHGLGGVLLEPLQLCVNFRSQQQIVEWVNRSFPLIMPVKDDRALGAVSYASSVAFHSALDTPAVQCHPFLDNDEVAEAEKIRELVQQAQADSMNQTLAILVRSRNHLAATIRMLEQCGLRYQALEIKKLNGRPVIQDLMALTQALLHRADRTAWLAVLRAPFCGMSLKDLHALVFESPENTLIDLLVQAHNMDKISPKGRQILSRIVPVLEKSILESKRCSLSRHVEGVWYALGGPACLTELTDVDDAEVYFQLLESISDDEGSVSADQLSQRVNRLYSKPDVQADETIQLMTIHKSKGLEFDTVILPGLGKEPPPSQNALLHWMDFSHDNQDDLLLAPMNATGEEKNPIAAYIQHLDNEKGLHEDTRLLYVAATRAKRHLHLLGHTTFTEKKGVLELRSPARKSLLSRLWPVLINDFEMALSALDIEENHQKAQAFNGLENPVHSRLVTDWVMPIMPDLALDEQEEWFADEQVEFDWASETARHIGTVVHRLLQAVGERGLEQVQPQTLAHYLKIAATLLQRLGVAKDDFAAAMNEVKSAMKAIFEDEKGQWILSAKHAEARCEWAISRQGRYGIEHRIIDRSFVDAHDIRWIIDYKTGRHSGSDVEQFLDREQQRYRFQLESYGQVVQEIDNRPIRLGLYFPLLRGWREWAFSIKALES